MTVSGLFNRLLERIHGSDLARNSLWMLGGQATRTIIQAVYFVFVARSLHNEGYGAFAGTTALVMVAAPFSGIGAGFLLIKNVARDRDSLTQQLGRGLCLILLSGCGLLVAVEVIARIALPSTIPWDLVLTLGLAELLFSKVVDLCAFAFIAVQQLKWTAAIQVVLSASRLSAIALLTTAIPHPSVADWGVAYAAATVLAALVALALTVAKLGTPRFVLRRSELELADGFFFSVSVSAQTFYNDIDKTMLTRMTGLGPSGIYAAAYRIIDVSFSPVSSLLAAAYSRFFRSGERGLANVWKFSRGLVPVAAGYAGACTILLLVTAPLLPIVLGAEYRDSVEALRWLAVIPFLRAFHYLLADALSGAGRQRARSLVQGSVAVFNVAINLVLIPWFSWRGAAWASIASDSLLVLGLLIATHSIIRSERLR